MMNDSRPPRQPLPPAGLCDTCRHARIVTNDRGSRFVRCGLADQDAAWPRYPRLPVVSCAGYERVVSR